VTDVLITGATGTVGYPIARDLVARGERVTALVRDPARARRLLPDGVEPVAGDVTDRESVDRAVRGRELVFHAAGLPEQWRRDSDDFARVNAGGSGNVADAALAAGVRRLIYTSTIDVFAWAPGEPFDETVLDPEPRPTYYERSKQEADRIVVGFAERGLETVFLHPAAVYGPVPALGVGLNGLLTRLAAGKIPMLLPGGMPVVYSEDVARAQVEAADRAAPGSRFIVADRYLTLAEIATSVAAVEPGAKVPRVMPLGVARAVMNAGEAVARLTGRPPLVARGEFEFLLTHPVPMATRLASELGVASTPWEEALPTTLAHYRAQGWRSAA